MRKECRAHWKAACAARANCLHLEERGTTKNDDDARLPIVASQPVRTARQTDRQTGGQAGSTVNLFFGEDFARVSFLFLLLLFPP